MAERKTKKKLTALADSLSAVYGQQRWGNQWHLYTLVRHWPELAGAAFADHSMPAYFRRDDLWVYAHNSLWMQQMHLCKTDIIAKINAFLQGRQTVEDIRWTLQPADLIYTPEEEYVSPVTHVDPDAEREFRAMAGNIEDAESRAALCRLWLRMETIKKKG